MRRFFGLLRSSSNPFLPGMRYRLIFTLAALIVLADQAGKWAVEQFVRPLETIAVTGFFNLVYVRNHGAAFGFLNDPDMTWQFWLFLAATLIAVCVILFIARKAEENERLLFVALGGILGGAVGNLIDRVRYRAVVDFLDFHLAGWHWPAFNLADIAICVGAGLAALLILRPPQRPRAPAV